MLLITSSYQLSLVVFVRNRGRLVEENRIPISICYVEYIGRRCEKQIIQHDALYYIQSLLFIDCSLYSTA